MQIDVVRLGDLIVLRPVGRLDNATSAEFQARLLQEVLQEVMSGAADLIVDLAAVEYISSGGLRALITAAKQKPVDRRMAVTGLHAIVQEVFHIAHCEELIPAFGSLDEVRRAWASRPQ